MIEFTKAYIAQGKTFATLEEAQLAEIKVTLLKQLPHEQWTIEQIACAVMDSKSELMNILTTTKDSRPRARKENGGTKRPRKPKTLPIIDASETAA